MQGMQQFSWSIEHYKNVYLSAKKLMYFMFMKLRIKWILKQWYAFWYLVSAAFNYFIVPNNNLRIRISLTTKMNVVSPARLFELKILP